MRTLIQPRTRGLSGPFFKRGNSIVRGFIKAPSAFYSDGGAGSGPIDPWPDIPFVATAVADGVWKALQKAATGTAVYSARDSVATVIDHEGLVKEVPDYTIRPQNARIVENLIRDSDHPYSEDLSLWDLNSAVTPTFTPEKGWLIENATPGNSAEIQCRGIGFVNSLVHIGDVVIARVRFGSLSFVGTAIIKIQEYNGGTYNTQSLINITDVVDGNVYTLTHTLSDATTNNIRLRMQAASGHTGSLYANFAQVEKVTGASVQDAPSEYVSVGVGTMEHGLFVDGIKAFATQYSNNSVTSGVVTEGTASGDISDNIDYLAEPSATNELFNGTTPATETRTIPTGDSVMWLDGSGSCVLSGGASGTATEGSPVLFNLGAPTAVTFTYSGSIDRAQCEAGKTPTSFIATDGAAVVRSADLVKFDLTNNFNQDAGTVIFDWITSVAQADQIATEQGLVTTSDAKIGLSSHKSTGVSSTDGTSTVTYDPTYIADNQYRVAIRWETTTFQIGIRDVEAAGSWSWGTDTTYDGAFALGSYLNLFFGILVPEQMKDLFIYQTDKGIDWIEANY